MLAFAFVVALLERRRWRAMVTPAGMLALALAGADAALAALRGVVRAACGDCVHTGCRIAPCTGGDRARGWIGVTTIVAGLLAVVLLAASGRASYRAARAAEPAGSRPRDARGASAERACSPTPCSRRPCSGPIRTPRAACSTTSAGRPTASPRWRATPPPSAGRRACGLRASLRCDRGGRQHRAARARPRPAPQLGAVSEYPAGVIALSAACGRSPAAPEAAPRQSRAPARVPSRASEPEGLCDQLVGTPAGGVVVDDRDHENLFRAVLARHRLEAGLDLVRRPDDDTAAAGVDGARLAEERSPRSTAGTAISRPRRSRVIAIRWLTARRSPPRHCRRRSPTRRPSSPAVRAAPTARIGCGRAPRCLRPPG